MSKIIYLECLLKIFMKILKFYFISYNGCVNFSSVYKCYSISKLPAS